MPSHPAPEIVDLGENDARYPAGLRDLADAPSHLFVRGRIPPAPRRAIAVVGSRAASPYGLAFAERLAADLAHLGFAVVSGLARGIDAAAHRGALAAGGVTIAVLPGGLDRITPRHHLDLADAVSARGALVTECAAGEPRWRGEFVRRNRLIAALAGATVVVEAAERSGALSTAGVARRLGRALLAVPGDVDRTTSRGCHALLRGGARLCEGAGDVVAALERWAAERGETGEAPEPDAPPEARLLAALGPDPKPVETLAAEASLPVPEALAALLALQWAGSARALPGQRWSRVGRVGS